MPIAARTVHGYPIMMGRSFLSRRPAWLAASAAALTLAVLWASARGAPPADPAGERAAGDTPARAARSTLREQASTPPAPPGPLAGDSAVPSGGDEGAGESEGEPAGGEAPAGASALVYPVDLAALRERLPDNLYWQLGAPTDDPEVLARRREEERRMNDLLGKVQSSTATEEEIHRYHDRRRRISEDYIAFATLVLEEHGAELPERDQGLYALSIRMHESRLRALPRKVEDALARRRARVAARR